MAKVRPASEAKTEVRLAPDTVMATADTDGS